MALTVSKAAKVMKVSQNGLTLTVANEHDLYNVKHVIAENCYHLPDAMTGWRVIDVGANIGCFTVMAAARGAQVWVYEPDESNFELLLRNTESTGAVLIPAGGGTPGRRTFYLNRANTSGHSFYYNPATASGISLEVSVVSLTDALDAIPKGEADLLKIDCEGAEVEILQQVIDGEWQRVRAIAAELHFADIPEIRADLHRQVRELEQHYKVEWRNATEWGWRRRDD